MSVRSVQTYILSLRKKKGLILLNPKRNSNNKISAGLGFPEIHINYRGEMGNGLVYN